MAIDLNTQAEGGTPPVQPLSGAAAIATVTQSTPVQAGAAEATAPLQPESPQVALSALLKQHPRLKDEIEAAFLQPERERRRSENRALEQRIRKQLADELSATAQRDQLLEVAAKVEAGDLTAAKKMAQDVRATLGRQTAEQERDTMQRQVASAVMKTFFGVDLDALSDDERLDVTEKPEKFQAFLREQSPVVRQWLQDSASRGQSDAQAVDTARRATEYGQRLMETPNPSSGLGEIGGSTPRSFTEIEREWLAGRVPNEDYYRARERHGVGGLRV